MPGWLRPGPVALLYAGVLIGVVFIATPAKFLAPTVPIGQLLDVGRQTFIVFGWVELAFGLLLLASAVKADRAALVLVIGVCAISLGEHLVLRPILDIRVGEIIDGADPTPSNVHHVYVALEVLKLALLIAICVGCCVRNRGARWGVEPGEAQHALVVGERRHEEQA